MTPGQRAEALVAHFGIRDAKDLDLEAIACDQGVTVEREDLSGCEATLIGFGDRAIATIKPSHIVGRERFSLAHELGHWDMHRGRSFQCRVDDPDVNLVGNKQVEKEADQFASHLLMPGPVFNPAVKALGTPSFKELEALATEFQTSMVATSLRIAAIDTLPVIVACFSKNGRHWSMPAPHVPKRWFVVEELSEYSFSYDLLVKGAQTTGLRKQSGEVWFQNDDAEGYELHEHSMPYRNGQVLVLLYLSSKMLDARFDPNIGRQYTSQGSYVAGRSTRR
jgi:Zn-dependent peptidase ImmA (M78 family)